MDPALNTKFFGAFVEYPTHSHTARLGEVVRKPNGEIQSKLTDGELSDASTVLYVLSPPPPVMALSVFLGQLHG